MCVIACVSRAVIAYVIFFYAKQKIIFRSFVGSHPYFWLLEATAYARICNSFSCKAEDFGFFFSPLPISHQYSLFFKSMTDESRQHRNATHFKQTPNLG